MNGGGAPHGNGMPFYRGAAHSQSARDRDSDDSSDGGPRYVPPHLRSADIVRPESSISNVTNKTFASQAPMGNYSFGPSDITDRIASYNPFMRNIDTTKHTTLQLRPYMGPTHLRPGAPGIDRSNRVDMSQSAPSSGRSNKRGYQGPNQSKDSNITSYMPDSAHYPSAIVAPTPTCRDSGATDQSHAAYLANRIMQGHADNPLDPDYGNPGPSRRPPPQPQPIRPPPAYKSPSENPLLPIVNGKRIPENNEGNPFIFIGSKKVALPGWLPAAVNSDVLPSLEQAFQSLPFIEAARYAIPSTAGVVKVAGIPYATTRAEVNAFLGKNTKICYQPAGTGFQAVHIIMDRHSGKTMDAFVEVSTHTEAIWVVNQFQKRVNEKRPAKIGGRVVDVALSNQDELMLTIFPRAKQTRWKNGVPVIDPTKHEWFPGVFSEGFKGFLQDEEIAHMYQHSDKPQRVSHPPFNCPLHRANFSQSPFVLRCMVRTYEYLITTLYKYPWFDIENVLLKERDALFEATYSSLHAMIDVIRKHAQDKPNASKPSVTTLHELATAIFLCPGFNDAQKHSVAKTLMHNGFDKYIDDSALNLRYGGVGLLDGKIPFHVLSKQPGVDDKVLEVTSSHIQLKMYTC